MHFEFFAHERSFAELPHPFFCECRGPSLKIPEPAGDQELSVGTPTSSSTVTAVSGSDGEVVGRCSVRTGKTRRWRTSTVRKNYDDHSLAHERHMRSEHRFAVLP
ncbi:hypothetical protein EVAR_79863_1 [Eumeta japonica]|uniref:Uncharacterized protein n=1 Tax=Eumeta variegata TaxID=151549 RepID=A0A4C1TYW3_EUMVA|nr:hypothetical protein EVAR_79863_1 [Eumeta japonica]